MVQCSQQAEPEHKVTTALAAYKLVQMATHYRNWRHRIMLWLGDAEAREAEGKLAAARSAAVRVFNRSEKDLNWIRLLSERQPSEVRARDKFLDLIR